ncbi:MAG: hypothetical protein CMJ31_04110 [Phycisphaerae bacterium]|nr:hypothetical protein [Phycisphaerae bacterium]
MEMLRGLLRSTVTQRSFKTLRLVVLNACSLDAAAREFVLAGVAHVIAHDKRVRGQVATVFTRSSYLKSLRPHVARRLRVSARGQVATVFTRSSYLAQACGRTLRDAFESAREAVQSSPSVFVLLPEGDSHREMIWKPSVHEPVPALARVAALSHYAPAAAPLRGLTRAPRGHVVLRHLTWDRRRLKMHVETGGAGKTQVALTVAHQRGPARVDAAALPGVPKSSPCSG